MNGFEALSSQRTTSRILKKARMGIAAAMKVGGGILFLFAMIFGMIAAALSMKKASTDVYEEAAVSGQRSGVSLEESSEKAAVIVSSSDCASMRQ